MKESILKGDGRGLQVQLLDVVIEPDEKKWYFEAVPFEEYICHVSCEFPIREVTVEVVEI